jgi:hypothetical protein
MTNNDAHHVVVDGSNIAFEGRETPSLRQLDEAVRAFLKEHPHDVLTVIVDATFAHRIDASEKHEYEAGIENGELVTPPAGAVGRGDAFVLEIAGRTGATVLSNDSFQEFHGEHAWLFDDGRLIGGKPIPDVGWVFVPRTPVRGPASRRAVQESKKGGGGRGLGRSGDKGNGRGPGRSGDKGSGRDADRALGDDRSRSGNGAKGSSGSGSGRPGSKGRGRAGADSPKSGGETPKKPPTTKPRASGSFAAFVEKHSLGSTVTGTVSAFASHGAHVDVDGVRCYLPLSAMADPPPNGAREVVSEGEELTLVVDGVNDKFENLDLAVPGLESPEAAAARESGAGVPKKKRRWGRRRR